MNLYDKQCQALRLPPFAGKQTKESHVPETSFKYNTFFCQDSNPLRALMRIFLQKNKCSKRRGG